jgi:hypothetical protein
MGTGVATLQVVVTSIIQSTNQCQVTAQNQVSAPALGNFFVRVTVLCGP